MSRVPPSASGSTSGAEDELEKLEELEELEELGDDAIVAHQQGAHVPKPRAQVTEEARSIVISDHSSPGSAPAPSPERRSRRRSERTEKTVVIRSRRQIDELRRAMAKHKPGVAKAAKGGGLLLWVIVGLAAFLAGGLVALFATPSKPSAPKASPLPVATETLQTSSAPSASAEPPSVSIDELPIEGQKKR